MKTNIRAAINEYIDRVDDTPAMGTTIKLIPGIEKSSYHSRRSALLTFLKGSNDAKQKLRTDKQEWYLHFEKIWKLRTRHHVESTIPGK